MYQRTFLVNQAIHISCRWEDGNNNLTSNLFTLITPLLQHTKIHQTYAHINLTQKKKKEKQQNNNNIKKLEKNLEKNTKTVRYVQ